MQPNGQFVSLHFSFSLVFVSRKKVSIYTFIKLVRRPRLYTKMASWAIMFPFLILLGNMLLVLEMLLLMFRLDPKQSLRLCATLKNEAFGATESAPLETE